MNLTENTIYNHDELGEVLVVSVDHIFETYDLDAGDGRLRSRVVRYTAEWDDYGLLPSGVRPLLSKSFRRLSAMSFERGREVSVQMAISDCSHQSTSGR